MSGHLALVLTMLTVTSLTAQSREPQEVPMVEPPLSQIYASDELYLGELAAGGAISPDGRWLVYSSAVGEDGGANDEGILGGGGMNLWIVPLDGSRAPARLTSGAYWDRGLFWFPSGDRILFRSDRARPYGLLTLDIDPVSGAAAGPPRQITLEHVRFTSAYGISGDGRLVAYVPLTEAAEPSSLKIMPAVGGRARTVWTQPEDLTRPTWGEDGFLYFLSDLAPPPDDAVRAGYSVRRVSTEGGEAETLSTWPEATHMGLSTDARFVLHRANHRFEERPVFELATVEGKRLAKFTLPTNMALETCFTRGIAECVATTRTTGAPIRVIPVNGGPVRQLTESREHNGVAGWSRDGREVYFVSELDGTRAITALPVGGGVGRVLYQEPRKERVYGPSLMDGRYLLYGEQDHESGAVLRIRDLESGSEQELTSSPWLEFTRYHWVPQSGNRFLYASHRDGRFEFMAVEPGEEPVHLQTFTDTAFPPIVGVHGDRIAYWLEEGGRSTLYLTRAGATTAQPVTSWPGEVGQRGQCPPMWSPDGRRLVSGSAGDALVVEFNAAGEVVGQPRLLENLPGTWWTLSWLPGGDGFLVVNGNVWLVPLDGHTSPVNLTAEESGVISGYALSPDGRHIAVAPAVQRGGAIWRVDLEAVLTQEGPEGP